MMTSTWAFMNVRRTFRIGCCRTYWRPTRLVHGGWWSIRMCPSDLGLPFRRKRRYTVFFRSDKIMFTGSYGGFVDLFFRRCELSGDIFFREGPGMADGDSKTKHECLQMYSELRRERIEANPVEAMQNICDLTQRPPFGSLDSLVPCFTTGSHIFNLPKGRFLAPLELRCDRCAPELTAWQAGSRWKDLKQCPAQSYGQHDGHIMRRNRVALCGVQHSCEDR